MFTDAVQDQAPKPAWPPQEVADGEINDWDLWIQSKLTWLSENSRPDENAQAVPSSDYDHADKATIDSIMGIIAPPNVETIDNSRTIPQLQSRSQPYPHPQVQPQPLPQIQTQVLSNDAWSELGLRAVLDSLNYGTPQWQTPQPGQFYSNPSAQGPIQAPPFSSGLDTANTAPIPGDIDFTNTALMGNIAASYDFSNFMPMTNMPQDPSMSAGIGHPYMSGSSTGLDETLMDTSDAQLVDAWRSMTDFPDFMGIDTAGLM